MGMLLQAASTWPYHALSARASAAEGRAAGSVTSSSVMSSMKRSGVDAGMRGRFPFSTAWQNVLAAS